MNEKERFAQAERELIQASRNSGAAPISQRRNVEQLYALAGKAYVRSDPSLMKSRRGI